MYFTKTAGIRDEKYFIQVFSKSICFLFWTPCPSLISFFQKSIDNYLKCLTAFHIFLGWVRIWKWKLKLFVHGCSYPSFSITLSSCVIELWFCLINIWGFTKILQLFFFFKFSVRCMFFIKFLQMKVVYSALNSPPTMKLLPRVLKNVDGWFLHH